MKQKNLWKLCLSLVVALTVLALAGVMAFAQPAVTEVSTEAELRTAVANGGEIKLINDFWIGDIVTGTSEPVVIEKDVILDLNGHVIELTNPGTESMFTVSGGSLTINGVSGENAFLGYNGEGSLFKVVGVAGKGTSLTINGGQIYARAGGDFQNPTFPAGIIVIEAAEGTVLPTVTINDGRFSCQNSTQSYFGPIVSGETDGVTVKGGTFAVNPEEFVAPNHTAIRDNDEYRVLPLAEQYSDAFKKYINKDGKFVVNHYQPEAEEPIDSLFEALWLMDETLHFYTSTLNEEDLSVYVSRYDEETWEIVETHKVNLVFQYDPAVRKIVKELLETLPEDPNGPYYFNVRDMELVNYWMSMASEREYTGNLMQYSGEFRKFVDYRNFNLDLRMGWDTPFYTEYAGLGNFTHSGTIYGTADVGVKAQHILYVPDATANTRQALIDAAQKRLNDYLGKTNAVTVEYAGTVEECYYRWHFEYFALEWASELPDISYEEWKQSSYCPVVSDADMEYCSGIEGLTLADDCYKTVINGVTHYLFLLPGSSQMISPAHKTADATTNIFVSTSNASIPLDTVIQAKPLTEGEEYEKLLDTLKIESGITYDIKLHSQSLGNYITSLENDEFEVRIPIPQEMVEKTLIAYYVDKDNEVTDYDVTVDKENCYAVFFTNHFSVYTIAEKKTVENNPNNDNNNTGAGTNPGTGNNNSGTTGGSSTPAPIVPNPETSDRTTSVLWAVLWMTIAITATTVLLRKRNQHQ